MDIISFKSFYNIIWLSNVPNLEAAFKQYILFAVNRISVSNSRRCVGVG